MAIANVHFRQGGQRFSYAHDFINMDYIFPEWISNHIRSVVCDEITYPFPNFNGKYG